MANETHKQPINPHGVRIAGHPSDTGAPRPDADQGLTPDAPLGISERLQAQKEGRHIQATDADGKPYADSQDPDAHEKGRARTGSPGNQT